jgi:hypothetical protein
MAHASLLKLNQVLPPIFRVSPTSNVAKPPLRLQDEPVLHCQYRVSTESQEWGEQPPPRISAALAMVFQIGKRELPKPSDVFISSQDP